MTKLQQAVRLLRHDDAAARRKAIAYLAKSGEQDAIKALAWAYKNDPDPELRELARKGGVYLKRELDNGQSNAQPAEDTHAGASSFSYEQDTSQSSQAVDRAFTFDDDEPEDDNIFTFDDEDAYDYGTSASNYDYGGSASSYDIYSDDEPDEYDYNDDYASDTGPIGYDARKQIDQAMSLHIDGDDAGALEALGKAVEIDRRAVKDHQAQNVATAVTGMDGYEVMQSLASPFERARLVESVGDDLDDIFADDGSVGSGKKKKKLAGEPSWGTVWLDLGIYGLVFLAGTIIVLLLGANRFAPLLQELQSNPEFQEILIEADLNPEEFDDLVGASAVFWGISSVGFGIYYMVMIMIQGLVYHFVATSMMGGKRSTTTTYNAYIPAETIILAVVYVVGIATLFLLPTEAAAYAGLSDSEIPPGLIASFGILGIGSFIYPFAYATVISIRLSNAQAFGFGKGCLSFIIGYILVLVVNCMFGFVLQAFGSVLLAFAGG